MSIITGMIPVAPTIFDDGGALDLDGQRRATEYLIDAGVDGICILANYSEQFSLTDAERDDVLDATLQQVSGRVPVVVTTSHFAAHVARQRVLEARRRGAGLVMMMPPFFGATVRVDDTDVVEYFKRVIGDIDIDVMIQDAPMSSTTLSVATLTRIAREIPQVRYVKVEVARAADKVRALAAAAGDALPGLYDGEEGVTLIPDLHAGVVGSMASSAAPFELRAVVSAFCSDDVEGAEKAWEDILPLVHFENRQCGLAAAKILLKEGGIVRSDAVRYPLAPVVQATRTQLVELAARRDAFVLRWAC